MNKKEIKICKKCKEEIHAKAKRCPKCGAKLGIPGWMKGLIIVIIILGCIVGCVNGCSKAVDDAVEETKNSYKDINGKTSFKLNESFQNKYEKITMIETNTNFTDYISKPADGYKVIMLKFEIENVNEESDELYISSLEFKAYADSAAVKQFMWANNDYKDFSSTLSKGKKTTGFVFYEVPKDAKKITVEYNADFWTDGTVVEFVVE